MYRIAFNKSLLLKTIALLFLSVVSVFGLLFMLNNSNSQVNADANDCFIFTLMNNDTEYSIKANPNDLPTGDVVIPNEYQGKPVTVIESAGFSGCDGISTLYISANIKTIEEDAFLCCELTSVEFAQNSKLKTIASSAFETCIYLESINLPEGLLTIGDNAFDECNLKEITIPSTVQTIGDYAFRDCTFAETITFLGTDLQSFGELVFAGCSMVEEITIPFVGTAKNLPDEVGEEFSDRFFFKLFCTNPSAVPGSVKKVTILSGVIYNRAFRGITTIQTIILGSGVTKISTSAFYGCSSLTSITIPSSVTSIGATAFDNCTSLTSIVIPTSVQSIGSKAFNRCSSLQEMDIPFVGLSPDLPDDSTDRYFYRLFGTDSFINVPSSVQSVTIRSGKIYNSAFSHCTKITTIVLGDDVSAIEDSAFYDCCSLTSINIPNGITSIGNYAFDYCSGLTSIVIPNSVRYIGTDAFAGCSALSAITLSDKLERIESYAFSNCSSLTSITLPNTLSAIQEYAFQGCSSLVNVIFPNNLEYISSGVFKNCTSLKTMVIPKTVTYMGNNMFYGCSSLTSISIPFVGRTLEEADDSNYRYFYRLFGPSVSYIPASLTQVVVSGGKIYSRAFQDCNLLTSITLGDDVSQICDYAFNGCTSLLSMTIPNGVTSIGKWAFSTCYKIPSIVIPSSVQSIGSCAFYGCKGITSVTLPNSLQTLGSSAFSNCWNITSVTYTKSGEGYSFVNGTLTIPNQSIQDEPQWKKDNLNQLILQVNIQGNGTNVENIGKSAFYETQNLKTITIPRTVQVIDDCAFCGSGLTSITFESNSQLREINDGAFAGCPNLESIAIPASVEVLGTESFMSAGLVSVTFGTGSNLKTIKDSTFETCVTLANVTLPEGVESIGNWAFDECAITSFVIPSSVKYMGGDAFYGCKNLVPSTSLNGLGYLGNSLNPYIFLLTTETERTSYEINGNCKFIGSYSFSYCNNFTSIIVPNSVIVIGYGSFYGCENLENVVLCEGLKTIESYAFCDCPKLKTITIPNTVTEIGTDSPFSIEERDEEDMQLESIIVDASNLENAFYLPYYLTWYYGTDEIEDNELLPDFCDSYQITLFGDNNYYIELRNETYTPQQVQFYDGAVITHRYSGKTMPNIIPVKQGYAFLGWYLDSECTQQAPSAGDELDENIDALYSSWLAIAPIEPDEPIEPQKEGLNETTKIIIMSSAIGSVVLIGIISVVSGSIKKSKKQNKKKRIINLKYIDIDKY